ncbi:MAG: nucleoside deaminase [Bacteroidetes bacterium]|nr:nucleoside deaminase [Bacteroidota bacterium]
MDQEYFMQEAIRLAALNVAQGGGGPFGAVIVKDNQIVGVGRNRVTSSGDPTAHAEVVAIRDACRNLGTYNLEGCTIFSSCEPCPMCLGAIYWARLSRLFYAATRHDAAIAGFDDEWLYTQIQLDPAERSLPATNIMRDRAVEVFQAWVQSENKIPY